MTTYYSDMFQPRQRGMRVLVACEYSGIVRNAFLERGHDAWSCDLLPSEGGSNRHIRDDARDILNDGWDLLNDGWDLLMVAHPPCTRLCNSGVRWLAKPRPGKTNSENYLCKILPRGFLMFHHGQKPSPCTRIPAVPFQ